MAAPSQTEPVLRSLHDLELATLASAGERDAFGELARRHGGAVRALLRRMGAEPALADDLAQDAFVAAYERIADFRGDGSFESWIKRIASRLYLRRWKKRLRLDPLAANEADLGDDAEAERQVVGRLDLDAALDALSTAERLCVTLCYGAGFSHAEAAEILAIPLGTVKSHMKRGLEKLKRRLGVAGPSTAGARRGTDA